MRVSVFMDVEDPINPLADEAAHDLARLFSEAGVRGSFCLTGEKCRTLTARGRQDVIDAFRRHCLGLHTDTHSFHPTTMELLAGVPYEGGCRLAYAAEEKGFRAFVESFGRSPAFWGGAGNTWSPEIPQALRLLEIPAYAYALTAPPNQAVHRFNGAIGLPQSLTVGEDQWAAGMEAAEKVLRALPTIPQPWVGIFVGHPTRFRYRNYWDTPYNAGCTPPEPEFQEPNSDEVYERSKQNLRIFLGKLKEEVEIVGVDDLLQLPWTFRKPTETEMAYFDTHTRENVLNAVKWPIHRPDLDPENIVAKTMALAHTLEIGELL